jgi:hypothetical protein
MKKTVLLFTVLALFANLAMAQNANVNIKFGINGVYNVGETDLGTMFQDFKDENPGYQVGAEFEAKLLSILGFRGEVNYVNGKFSYTNERTVNQLPDGTIGNFDIIEKMNIINKGIQIPTSLTLNLGLLDLNVGPNFEFLLSSVASGNFDAINLDSLAQNIPTSTIDYDFINDLAGEGAYYNQSIKDGNFFNTFNVGLNLGLGVDLGKLRLDLKTNYTLTDAVNDYYQSTQGQIVDRPISFQLSGVYQLFSIGKNKGDDKKKDKDEPNADWLLIGY